MTFVRGAGGGHELRCDYRDLAIEGLAQENIELREQIGALTSELQQVSDDCWIYRELSHTSIAMLAKVSYQRDQALRRLFPGRGDEGHDDDAVVSVAERLA